MLTGSEILCGFLVFFVFCFYFGIVYWSFCFCFWCRGGVFWVGLRWVKGCVGWGRLRSVWVG